MTTNAQGGSAIHSIAWFTILSTGTSPWNEGPSPLPRLASFPGGGLPEESALERGADRSSCSPARPPSSHAALGQNRTFSINTPPRAHTRAHTQAHAHERLGIRRLRSHLAVGCEQTAVRAPGLTRRGAMCAPLSPLRGPGPNAGEVAEAAAAILDHELQGPC